MSQRFLRSKKLRAMLWIAAQGKCQRCGRDLDDRWDADHVLPWSKSKETNFHDMQALCHDCNLRKGAMGLRQLQFEMQKVCRDLRSGAAQYRSVIISATPGGGKSCLPVIAAKELVGTGFADALCWVVPRVALQEQAERVFLGQEFRRILQHSHEIRTAANEPNPTRGLSGYVTTYQAIASSNEVHIDAMRRKRYVLVLDEPHHIANGDAWHRQIEPLVEASKLAIYMSGTLDRGDGKQIALLPYIRAEGGLALDLTPTSERAVIRYSRSDALRERAKLRIFFSQLDASGTWVDRTGQMVFVPGFQGAGKDSRNLLWTALSTEFALDLLDHQVSEWLAHRESNPRSKLLVVAANIGRAKEYQRHLDRTLGIRIRAEIATSDDSAAALEAIRRYKDSGPGRIDVLVTVAMAYEGLDVPEITHIACLTHIRSRPWIEQMLDRATRVDPQAGPWESQFAHVALPDDEQMNQIIAEINAEQASVVSERAEDGGCRESDAEDVEPMAEIAPIGSDVAGERSTELGAEDGLGRAETLQIRQAMEKQGIRGVTPLQLKRLFVDLGFASTFNGAPQPQDDHALMTPTQREENLKRTIEKYCRRYDSATQQPFGTMNNLIRRQFGKSRSVMELPELMRVWAWLQENHSIDEVTP